MVEKENENKITSARIFRCGDAWNLMLTTMVEKVEEAAMAAMAATRRENAKKLRNNGRHQSFSFVWHYCSVGFTTPARTPPSTTQMSHGITPICIHLLVWTKWIVLLRKICCVNITRIRLRRAVTILRWTINHRRKAVGVGWRYLWHLENIDPPKNFSNFNLNLAFDYWI